ncbi:Sodium/potassium-transporting ATPase subunit beta-2 [Acromyrmex echinatior]|uniref:Sodium/potassium-transporting ATPase subunit beta-2 n=1 Tax=Acromyrmex echinatior TaxID=103372 RepID=F4WKT4_ACREC|nr:Sodium/potassium-transporting ATPase subunit beta-2 [Acromyrmex echinatior]
MSVRGKQVQNGTYEFDYMRAPDTRTRWQIIRHSFHNPIEGTYCGHTPKKWDQQPDDDNIPDHMRSRVLSCSCYVHSIYSFQALSCNLECTVLKYVLPIRILDLIQTNFTFNLPNRNSKARQRRHIYGWIPEFYNNTQNLPPDMPETLVKYIKLIDASWVTNITPINNATTDISVLHEKFHSKPKTFFVGNQIINVECRAWAKNIEYSSIRSEKKGAVHFELMVDE